MVFENPARSGRRVGQPHAALLALVARLVEADAPRRGRGDHAAAETARVTAALLALVTRLGPRARGDLTRYLALVEHVGPLLTRRRGRFSRLDAGGQDEVLRALEASRLAPLREASRGVRALVVAARHAGGEGDEERPGELGS